MKISACKNWKYVISLKFLCKKLNLQLSNPVAPVPHMEGLKRQSNHRGGSSNRWHTDSTRHEHQQREAVEHIGLKDWRRVVTYNGLWLHQFGVLACYQQGSSQLQQAITDENGVNNSHATHVGLLQDTALDSKLQCSTSTSDSSLSARSWSVGERPILHYHQASTEVVHQGPAA